MNPKLHDTFKDTADRIAFLNRGVGLDSPDVQSAIEEVHSGKGQRVFNVKAYGAGRGGDDTAIIQSLIDQALPEGRNGARTIIWFPPGVYNISDSLKVKREIDYSANLVLIGAGRRLTRITQTDDTKPIFELRNTTYNLRDITIRDMHLHGGSIGLELENTAYIFFENLTFQRQSVGCILDSTNSQYIWFRNCWFVHLKPEAYTADINGSMLFSDCKFGDGFGPIITRSSHLRMYNCYMHGASNNMPEWDGPKATFIFLRGSHNFIYNTLISQSQEATFYINEPRFVKVMGSRMNIDKDCSLIISNNLSPNDMGGSLTFTDNIVQANFGEGTCSFYSTTSPSRVPFSKAIIANNLFKLGERGVPSTITFDDRLLDPLQQNYIAGNILKTF